MTAKNKVVDTPDGPKSECQKCKFLYSGKRCSECVRLRAISWRLANPEKSKANTKKWREKNPGKMLEKSNRWRMLNPEKVKAIAAASRAKYPEKIKANRHAWHVKNKESENAKSRAWKEENPEKVRAQSSRYYVENQEVARKKNAEWMRENAHKRKAQRDERRDNLSDSYVASTLKLNVDQIPTELIELKRVQLQITRKLKELKK